MSCIGLEWANWLQLLGRFGTSDHAQSLPMAGRRCCRVNRQTPARLMAVSMLQLDLGLTGPDFTAGLPLIPVLRGIQGLVPETWADSQLATGNDMMKGPPKFVSTTVQWQGDFGKLGAHEGHWPVQMCRKLCEDGRITVAVDALNFLVRRGCHVPNNLFYRVLKRCIAQKDLVVSRRVHALTIESGYDGDAFLATHLIGLYASYGMLEDAMLVFTKVSTPSSYNWATIIFAHARQGEAAGAIRLYREMLDSTTVGPTNRIYLAVLKACAAAGDLVAGKEVHAHILDSPGKPDIFVETGLIDMYAKCRSLEDARRVFDRLRDRNVVTWNALLAGYAQQGLGQEAMNLYNSMRQEGHTLPDSVTFVSLLQACAGLGVAALDQGKQLHAHIEEQKLQDDVVVGGSLVNMYAKCGSLEDARAVFDRLAEKNGVTWNVMIAGYAQQDLGQEALSLYSSMQQDGLTPDSVSCVCLLQACASVGAGALHQGTQLHAQIEELGLQDDVGLGAGLVNMYAKCGCLEYARSLFDGLPDRNVITWTAMIAGYTQHEMCLEALHLYRCMQEEGITPNCVTFVCVLQACAVVAALPLGKQLHVQIEERGYQADVIVGAALVNMYAKCGSMLDAQQVFDSLPKRTIEAWGALTAGYTRQGDSGVVFDLLERMKLESMQPNGIVFLNVLTVCSHVGLVDKGCKYFESMRADYGVSPTVEHYRCMIDLLGRAGHLDEAFRMAKAMPFPTCQVVWLSLLGACRKWNNVAIGQQVFEFAVGVNEQGAAAHMLMSNIYSSAQMWVEARAMHARRVKSGAWKQPGQSWWTDMGGAMHMFVVGDKMYPEIDGAYSNLEQLAPNMSGGHVGQLH